MSFFCLHFYHAFSDSSFNWREPLLSNNILHGGNYMRISRICSNIIVLAGIFLSSTSSAAPTDLSITAFHDTPSLTSITFWEISAYGPTPWTFATNSQQLLTRLNNLLGPSNNDFYGVPDVEFYDVFYSNANGSFNANGGYVTIEAECPIQWIMLFGGGGSLNIAEVNLNFAGGRIEHVNYVASYLALLDNPIQPSVINAIDGNLYTTTRLGATNGDGQRLSLTLGYIPPTPTSTVPIPAPFILLGSGLLGLLGIRRRIHNT
jgi:hypothetical protein